MMRRAAICVRRIRYSYFRSCWSALVAVVLFGMLLCKIMTSWTPALEHHLPDEIFTRECMEKQHLMDLATSRLSHFVKVELNEQGRAKTARHPKIQGHDMRTNRRGGGGGGSLNAMNSSIYSQMQEFWTVHRKHPIHIEGTDSVISVNTSHQGEPGDYLQLLQALMFRIRPPDSTYNINVTLSDQIPLDRAIPDSRQPECLSMRSDAVQMLPDVSVIIPFFNEPLSMLLRTVHSLVGRTPRRLLREIILIDDASGNADLALPLERYLMLMTSQVVLVRNTRRLGLIRTRQLGAELARGAVLVFLDAHSEVNTDWLPPMLAEIVKDPRTVVQPIIDNINADTLQYEPSAMDSFIRSAFTWDLRLVWTRLPGGAGGSRRPNPAAPFPAPILVGCAIAVDRKYFAAIGGFDREMVLWGGENVEVALRVWLCGGRVLSVPCARVGHTFRHLPYLNDKAPAQIEHNLLRTAELWMGAHKALAYGAIPDRNLSTADLASVARRRRELRRLGLRCRSFDWYLATLLPEVSLPPVGRELFGEIANCDWTSCLMAFVTADGGDVDLTGTCFQAGMLPHNYFTLDEVGHLVHVASGLCMYMEYDTDLLLLARCRTPPTERWHFRRILEEATRRAGQLVLQLPGGAWPLCLTQTAEAGPPGSRTMRMRICHSGWDKQVWLWTYDLDLMRMRGYSSTHNNS